MSRQKTGLILFTIGWIVTFVGSVCSNITAIATVGSWVTLVASILELIGMIMAAKTLPGFKGALITVLVQVVLTFAAAIFMVLASTMENATFGVIGVWIAFVVALLNLVEVIFLIRGCGQVSGNMKGLSKVTEIIIYVAIIASVVCQVIAYYNATAGAVLAWVAIALNAVYQILIIILLIRAIKNSD